MRRWLALVAATTVVGGVAAGWVDPPVASAATSCADLGGTIESPKICHIHTRTNTYNVDLRFPFDYADQQALNDYVVKSRDGFVNVAKTTPPQGRTYEMHSVHERFRSGSASGGTQSVVLEFFQDVGGPQPSTWYQAFNYDLSRRRPITFDNLFAPDTDAKPVEVLAPIVQRDLEQQTGVPAFLISPGVCQDPTHYQHFAITDDELIFYFAPGEMVPETAGAPAIRIERSTLPPLAL